ncbi:hypothetical protein [Kineosporia sp. NBRC 101731]|uniref:hypothetical protein n=1 Tax=Kineosporia sp. NBRC 101731 TaxID=3032199 RepID=UPI0024A5830F|nr:hypothetical protein [Kineosporia sp. NBRC 101731]GLY31249.1 hypothetical protein Kisp02_46140 [Kineosporia sp. NBRC 101731]
MRWTDSARFVRGGATALRRAAAVTAFLLGVTVVFMMSGSTAAQPRTLADDTPATPSGTSALLPTVSGTSGPLLPTASATAWPFDSFPTTSTTPTPSSTSGGAYGISKTTALTSSGIPARAYQAYRSAAAQLAVSDPTCKIDWALIAGIGRVESNHGRYGGSGITQAGLITPPILGIRLDGSTPGTARIGDTDNGAYDGDSSVDRAVGPMQFLPGTWKAYGQGNPQDIDNAALATGKYLCAGSSSLDTRAGQAAAVYRYNRSNSYVSLVLSLATAYRTGEEQTVPDAPADTPTPRPTGEDTDPPGTAPGPPPALPQPPKHTTPTKTAKPTKTSKPTTTSKPTKTGKPTPTKTPKPTTTVTPTTRPTPTKTVAPTPTPTTTVVPTTSPTPTVKPPASPTPTDSCTTSPTPTATGTATPTPTPTPTTTPSPTPTPCVTSAPAVEESGE